MPSIKPLPYSVALAVAALTHAGQSAAVDSPLPGDRIWNCTATNSGGWQCGTIPTVRRTLNSAAPITPSAPTINEASAYGSHQTLDWVERPQRGLVCEGRYIEPKFKVHGDEAEADPPVYLDAGSSSSALGGLTKLRGGINLRQGKRRLSAAEADVDKANNSAVLRTDVIYREPGMLVVADEAQLRLDTEQGRFTNARFVMHEDHLRGQAEEIRRDSPDTVELVEGRYTYCPPGNEDWQIVADHINLNQASGFGTAKHATLKVGPVPILYVPYLSFPIDDRRKSGFLYPEAGYDKTNGIDVAAPYYFNLAPNYDDTLTPRYIAERGVMLENEFRYLNDLSRSRLSLAYLPDDDLYQDDRWLASLSHTGTPWAGWYSAIDYNSVSDDDYFDDLETTLRVERTSTLNRKGELRYYADNWNALARLHGYQNLTDGTSPYNRLPQLQLNGNYGFGDTETAYQAEYVYFDRDNDNLTGSSRVIGSRLHFAPRASHRFGRSWGYLNPSVQLWSTQYDLEDQVAGADDAPGYTVPVFSLDSGLVLERALAQGGIQTLEPRVFLLYVPNEDQSEAPVFDTARLDFDYSSLFRTNRFSGRDRIGDAQQLSLGLTSRWIDATGYERGSISLGQALYFDDREQSVTGLPETASQSNFALEAVWNYSRQLRITLDNVLAYSDLEVKETNVRLNYKADSNHRFNLSYRYEEDVRNQTDLHFIWPVANQWSAIGRWQHDLDAEQDIESVLGIEYESCCWKLQLTGRQWLTGTDEYNKGVFLRFTLKGLGALNSGSTGFLNEITGFEERDEQNDF